MRRSLRLLAFSTSFPLRSGDAAGIFVRRLYEHLPTCWRVDVVCPADNGRNAQDELGDERVSVHAVAYAPRSWRVLAQQSGGVMAGVRRAPWRVLLLPLLLFGLLWRGWKASKPADIIHANWSVCGVLAVWLGHRTGRPVVTTLRGDDVSRAVWSWFDRVMLDIAVRGSQAIICVSEAMAASLRQLYPQRMGDIHVGLNGVDPALCVLSRPQRDANCLRVIVVGSLIRRKGVDLLIAAIAMTRLHERIDVRIVGGGPELAMLRLQAEALGVANYCEFLDELSPGQIPAQLAWADVLVLPSRSEGRPNAVLEAMAAGLPVIATPLPGLEGLLEHGETGWVFAHESVSELAAALQAATVTHERLRRGRQARERMQNVGADWAGTGRTYDAIFQQVLATWQQGKG